MLGLVEEQLHFHVQSLRVSMGGSGRKKLRMDQVIQKLIVCAQKVKGECMYARKYLCMYVCIEVMCAVIIKAIDILI